MFGVQGLEFEVVGLLEQVSSNSGFLPVGPIAVYQLLLIVALFHSGHRVVPKKESMSMKLCLSS